MDFPLRVAGFLELNSCLLPLTLETRTIVVLRFASGEATVKFVLGIEGMKAVIVPDEAPMPWLVHDSLYVVLWKWYLKMEPASSIIKQSEMCSTFTILYEFSLALWRVWLRTKIYLVFLQLNKRAALRNQSTWTSETFMRWKWKWEE